MDPYTHALEKYEFDCIFCNKSFYLKDCIGQHECFYHPGHLKEVENSIERTHYVYEYSCCNKKRHEIGCKKIDHLPSNIITDQIYLIPLYTIKDNIIKKPKPESIKSKKIETYTTNGKKEINYFKSYLEIKKFQ